MMGGQQEETQYNESQPESEEAEDCEVQPESEEAHQNQELQIEQGEFHNKICYSIRARLSF